MQEIRSRILLQARKSFGHIAERDDIDMLCLMVSMLQRHTAERNEALSMNAKQAGLISSAYVQISELKEKLGDLT